jgi:tetratricopeptide (TPR) repeat protein
MRYRPSIPAAAAFLLLILAGCATTITYVPTDDNARMSLSKARRLMAKHHIKIVDNKTLVTDPHYMFQGRSPITLPLKGMQVASGKNGTGYGSTVLEFTGSGTGRFSLRYMINTEQELAEAIYVVKRQAEREGFQPRDEEGEFDKTVAAYHEAAEKPELSLETRKFKVQAEDALREKRFEDVADLYGEALAISPWWPAGHYNRALVLSELKEYSDAIAEMKRYLRLAPEAANVRAAQDEIFKWEAKVGEK